MQVFKARLDDSKDVAVKYLNHEAAASQANVERFMAEINLLQTCRDASIVACLGAYAHKVLLSSSAFQPLSSGLSVDVYLD